MDFVLTISALLTITVTAISSEKIHFEVLADQGQSCREACLSRHSTCNMMELESRNEEEIELIFRKKLGVACTMDRRTWWSFDQPSVVVDPRDENFGRCLGWRGRPDYYDCSARWPTVRRLCMCSTELRCSIRGRNS
ncbi:hypothetical protein D918_08303 [Trichuris suis]|nr:hypothetical protein D918_08303 [Trichuris suis]